MGWTEGKTSPLATFNMQANTALYEVLVIPEKGKN